MKEGTLARKEDILRQSLLRGNLRGTSGDQGKDHVRPRKRPKLEEALKPSPVAVAIGGGVMSWRPSGEQAGVGWLEVDEWRPS